MVFYKTPADMRQRSLVWFLAMEEFIAGEGEGFFIWQVPSTVIFGRNQVMEAEVNVAFCKQHGINLFRRKSGGGCVYADMGNIMISYFCGGSRGAAFMFDRYLQRLTLALKSLGLDASRSGRNDVLVAGRKVSGNALFKTPSAAIVHGTLLYDTDFDMMQEAITPSSAKIESKGISSVRQRVTNLKTELEAIGRPLSQEDLKSYLINFLKGPDGVEVELSDADMEEISRIEASYLDPGFIAGRNHTYSLSFSGRTRAGELCVSLDMDGNFIKACHLDGDFFVLEDSDIDAALTSVLKGCTLERPALKQAFAGTKLEELILNLDTSEFINLITNN